jgi:hypothetical protein
MPNFKFKRTDKVEFYWSGTWIDCEITHITVGSPCYKIKFQYKNQMYLRWTSTHKLRFKNPQRERVYANNRIAKRFLVDL